MNHEQHMREALAQAYSALEQGEIPVGAVVVYEGRIIASAHNEREIQCDPTAHAEVLALRRAAKALGRRRLHGCSLYVTMEPCPMCAGAIVMSEVEQVFFGAYDAAAGCAGSVYCLPEDPAFTHAVHCCGGVLEKECSGLLREFFDGIRE